MTTQVRAAGGRQRHWIERLGLVCAVVLAATVMALAVPFVEEARLTRQCTELGGQLHRSTEDVEPLVVALTAYQCYGPDGELLDSW